MLTASLPSAHRFRWLKDGELFGSETEGSGTLRGDNSSLDMLEGEYRCYASNSLGTAMTQTVKVNVERESQTYCRHTKAVSVLWGSHLLMHRCHTIIKSHTHFSESVRLIGATCSLISSCHGNHFPETALWRHSGGWSRWLRSACTQMKYYTVLALSASHLRRGFEFFQILFPLLSCEIYFHNLLFFYLTVYRHWLNIAVWPPENHCSQLIWETSMFTISQRL